MVKSDVIKRKLIDTKSLLEHNNFPAFIFGLVVSSLVCYPFLGGGRLLLLDWVIGPESKLFGSTFFGLNGGQTTGVIENSLMSLVNLFIGGASTWILIAIFFPVSSLGAARMIGSGRWAKLATGALYSVNPFVFGRIYVGQLALLAGYALLPYAVLSLTRSLPRAKTKWLVVSLWWTILTTLSPHFFWIFGLAIFMMAVINLSTAAASIKTVFVWLFVVVTSFISMSCYLISTTGSTSAPVQVGAASLGIFRTTGDPNLGLLPNVASFYGFWRLGPGPLLPKNVEPGWFFIFLVISAIAVVPNWPNKRTLRVNNGSNLKIIRNSFSETSEDSRKKVFIASLGVFGYFLALGSQGPTGFIFNFIYTHIYFFQIMREPQKFLMLWILGFAVFYGRGVGVIINLSKSKIVEALLVLLLCVGLIIAYTPIMFNGLNGQIKISHLPHSYDEANKQMGTGPGKILYLPWHLYMPYPFTENRTIANIAPVSFSRDVVSGDNLEAGGVSTQSTSKQSAYLQALLTNGPSNNNFGLLIAPLGIRFVVLAKTSDYTSYSWLKKQDSLKLVFRSSDLEIWANLAYVGLGTSVQDSKLNLRLVTPSVIQLSSTNYRISSAKPRWVSIAIPYQSGWKYSHGVVRESPYGTLMVYATSKSATLSFGPWKQLLIGYIISSTSFVLVCGLVLVENLKKRKYLNTQ